MADKIDGSLTEDEPVRLPTSGHRQQLACLEFSSACPAKRALNFDQQACNLAEIQTESGSSKLRQTFDQTPKPAALDTELLARLPTVQFELSVNCRFENVPSCSSAQFCTRKQTPKCLLVNLVGLPPREIINVMQTYMQMKHADLAMQACFIKDANPVLCKQHFQTMQAFDTYGKGCNKRQLLHDPPTISDAMTPCMQASVAGTAGRLCFDSRSALNCISEQFCKNRKISIRPVDKQTSPQVTMADGSLQTLTGQCTVQVKAQGYSAYLRLAVLPLADTHDVILGEPWLTAHSATIQYNADGVLVVKVLKNSRRIRLIQHPSRQAPRDDALPVQTCLSAMQTRKAVKNAVACFGVMVKQTTSDASPDDQAATDMPSLGRKTDADMDIDKNEDDDRVPQAELSNLLKEFGVCFEPLEPGLPPDRGVDHTIRLQPGAKPTYKSPYRLSPLETEEVTRQIKELLRLQLIQPSCSPYGASVLFVQKKDGSLRMCIDYRALNKQTIQNKYPLPRIDELLDKVRKAKVFSSLDLTSGYHQLRIDPDDVQKTAFTVPGGHYEFRVLPFGLTNAPATFQHAMNKIFKDHSAYVVVYLDDILVFSNNAKDHAKHLRTVMQVIEDHQLKCKLKKCEFNKVELQFLGHVVGKSGLKTDPSKIDAIKDWPRPRNVHEMKCFLGLTNYFRKFIKGYANRVAPLNNLLRKTIPYHWTDTCQQAFEDLKTDLTESPVLVAPDMDQPFEIIADACKTGIGAVLMQNGRPIAYESRKYIRIPAESRYHTTDQELLAIVEAVKKWRYVIEGLPKEQVRLVTDHHPLVCLPQQPNLSRRQARWSELLQRYNFQWEYRPGRTNVADPISRRPWPAENQTAPLEALTKTTNADRLKPVVYTPFQTDIEQGYAHDAWFQTAHEDEQPECKDKLWWRGAAICVPNRFELRERLLREAHGAQYSGHPDAFRTTKSLQRHYWWPAMAKDVQEHVGNCPLCQRNKAKRRKPYGELQPLSIPEGTWDSVSMDFITQLPKSRQGNTSILVFVDRLSKMTHFAATKDTCSAADVADLYFDKVIKLHGRPLEIISDRDTRFQSAFWQELQRHLGTQICMSTAYHPQSDGQTERMNAVLEDMLRHYINPSQDNWEDLLPLAEFAINNAFNKSIQDTPFHVNYGKHPRTPYSLNVTNAK